MIFRRKHDLVYAAFSNFEARPEIAHGIFLLKCDENRKSDARLNAGTADMDNPDTVNNGRELVHKSMGGIPMVFLRQVHGKSVFVSDDDASLATALDAPPEADAAVTSQKGVALVIQVADCQPILLYDPVRRAVANIHSGWRGSIANIIGACIETMGDRFGTQPADLIAGVGPSLGPCCAEFVNYRKEIPEAYWKYKDAEHRFNFWQISHDQLAAAGVPASNIECSGICTKCNPHLFFSYRHAGETGRFGALIALTQ